MQTGKGKRGSGVISNDQSKKGERPPAIVCVFAGQGMERKEKGESRNPAPKRERKKKSLTVAC